MDLSQRIRAGGIAAMFSALSALSGCPGQNGSGNAAKGPTPHPRLGINLNGPADWNTELPFVDVFHFSRPWSRKRTGPSTVEIPPLTLDEHGWITRLDRDCWSETPLCTIDGGHYPAGTYTVLYDGEGTIEFFHAAKVVSREPGKITLDVQSSRGMFYLRIMSVNPANYLRNIRVILPGFLDQYAKNPWNPGFLKRWEGMSSIRFMDWMQTNNSKVVTWAQRPHVDDASFCERGVPLELMIDLSNRLKADPWFCMPHRADDDYVRRFAQMVKDSLDPGLRIYVEYSNEVWNKGFEQCRFVEEEGRRRGVAEKPWEAGWRYTAHRSLEIFKIWEEVFGAPVRLVRVLPSQAANTAVTRGVVESEEAYKHADALAIAPYLHFSIPPETRGKEPGTRDVERWTVDQVLDHLEQAALPQSIDWIRSQKKVADQFGLKLIAYEAGQHMVGTGGGENNEAVTRLLLAANAHPRLQGIYAKYLEAWRAEGGDLLCHFSSVGAWSKWGSWGLLQFSDEDASKSPKYSAVMRWARAQGQKVVIPD
jgi:hypothetical protein